MNNSSSQILRVHMPLPRNMDIIMQHMCERNDCLLAYLLWEYDLI